MRRCPMCKNRVEQGSAFAPFCSERCKLIDLGNWLGEGYRIPDETASPSTSQDEDRGSER